MTRIAIIAHPDKPEAMRLAGLAEKELAGKGLKTIVSTDSDADLSAVRHRLAVVFGGDGTVLRAVSSLGPEPPPILAFNLGRLGYLAENPPGRFAELIELALAGKLMASRRMTIEASIPARRWNHLALNEFVVASRLNGRQLPLSVRVGGEELMDIRGDGIIMATPTGSTAYALSAGGPVTSPELSAIILAPICPHQLANRSLVLAPGETVMLEHYSDFPVELMADGRFRLDMEKGEVMEVRVARTIVEFLFPARGKYKLLREKLGWGWSGTSHDAGPAQ